MIKKETVFILGAGASAPFGFPTGRNLLLEVCKELERPKSALIKQLLWRGFRDENIREFGGSLYLSQQQSIDAFIENRPEYVEFGKIAIATSLISYEKSNQFLRGITMSWYEYLFNQLGPTRKEFEESKLWIITFNYDRSLEYFLRAALVNSYNIDDKEAAYMLGSLMITHVYGQLGEPHFINPDSREYTNEITTEAVEQCIKEIKVLSEGDLSSNEFARAQVLIKNAEVICFLGFGYHHINVERLGINDSLQKRGIFGSAYGLGRGECYRVERMFGGKISLGLQGEDVLDFLRNYPVF